MKLRELTKTEKKILKEFFVKDDICSDIIDSMAWANKAVENGVWLCYDITENKKYCISIQIEEEDGCINKLIDEFIIDVETKKVEMAYDIDILN